MDNIVKENDEDFGYLKENKENWTSLDVYYKGFHAKRSISRNVSAKGLKETIEEFITAGFKPSWNEDTNKIATTVPAQTVQSVPTNVPVCQIHQVPMTWKTGVSKTSGKPYAFWACSLKNPDGTYCKYQPK